MLGSGRQKREGVGYRRRERRGRMIAVEKFVSASLGLREFMRLRGEQVSNR